MNKKTKKIIVIVTVIAIVIALVPYQCGAHYRDGGTRKWRALIWEVLRYHKSHSWYVDEEGRPDPYEDWNMFLEGWRVKILGFTVYDDWDSFGLGYESRYV